MMCGAEKVLVKGMSETVKRMRAATAAAATTPRANLAAPIQMRSLQSAEKPRQQPRFHHQIDASGCPEKSEQNAIDTKDLKTNCFVN